MVLLRISTIAIPLLVLAGCTVNPRPVVVTTPAPVVQSTPAPVVMGAPASSGPVTVEVPAGHFPPAGSCRIWRPGVAPTQQDLPGNCADLQNRVPAGSILLRG